MKIRRIFDNIEIKLICLLLAFVMWLYSTKPKGMEAIDRAITAISQGNQGRIRLCGIPVQLEGAEGQWESDPEVVLLEVKSLSAEVEIADLRAVIKLTQQDQEERRVTITADNIALPERLIFVKAEPKELKIAPMP